MKIRATSDICPKCVCVRWGIDRLEWKLGAEVSDLRNAVRTCPYYAPRHYDKLYQVKCFIYYNILYYYKYCVLGDATCILAVLEYLFCLDYGLNFNGAFLIFTLLLYEHNGKKMLTKIEENSQEKYYRKTIRNSVELLKINSRN